MEHSEGLQWEGHIDPKLKETMGTGQLPMFMTPNEILATHTPSDYDRLVRHNADVFQLHDCKDEGCRMETDDEMWERKLKESSSAKYLTPLPESIAREGVNKPVELVNYKHPFVDKHVAFVGNGHHRVVSAHSVKPDSLIPVTFTKL